MSLTESIRKLVECAPPDATVTVRWLGELVAADGEGAPSNATGVDLTVPQVAARFGKASSTVRAWLTNGDLPGAYRLHGREWRIPESAIVALQHAQSEQHGTAAARPGRVDRTPDIGEWRGHLKSAAA